MKASKAQGHRKTKIIVVINQKGGQGKTSVSFNLAHAAVKDEASKVLCLDLDSQGNLSQCLADDLEVIKRTQGGVGDLFDGIAPSPEETIHPQIHLLHGHKELDRYDKDGDAEERAYSPDMSGLLRGLGYDVVIIDTPPAVGLRQLAPLMWADMAVIPLEPTIFGITGFQEVLSVIDKDIRPINPALQWVGVINRVNMRVKAHREKDAWVRETYGESILATLSARTAVADAMEESPARPVWGHRGAPRELREQWLACCSAVIDR